MLGPRNKTRWENNSDFNWLCGVPGNTPIQKQIMQQQLQYISNKLWWIKSNFWEDWKTCWWKWKTLWEMLKTIYIEEKGWKTYNPPHPISILFHMFCRVSSWRNEGHERTQHVVGNFPGPIFFEPGFVTRMSWEGVYSFRRTIHWDR